MTHRSLDGRKCVAPSDCGENAEPAANYTCQCKATFVVKDGKCVCDAAHPFLSLNGTVCLAEAECTAANYMVPSAAQGSCACDSSRGFVLTKEMTGCVCPQGYYLHRFADRKDDFCSAYGCDMTEGLYESSDYVCECNPTGYVASAHSCTVKPCKDGQYRSAADWGCYNECPADLFVDQSTMQCVAKCPHFHTAQRVCVDSCKSSELADGDSQCVTNKAMTATFVLTPLVVVFAAVSIVLGILFCRLEK